MQRLATQRKRDFSVFLFIACFISYSIISFESTCAFVSFLEKAIVLIILHNAVFPENIII